MSGLISFERVENMKLNCGGHECIDFLKDNPHVTKLHLFDRSLDEQDILQIGDSLPNLVELELDFARDGTNGAKPFIQLIQTNSHLKKITLDHFGSKIHAGLREQTIKDWTVNEDGHKIALRKSIEGLK